MPAPRRTITLNWHEAAGPAGARLVVDLRRVVVGSNGWSVTAAVENDTHVTLAIGRPHHPGETEFGLLPLSSSDVRAVDAAGPGVFASSFAPPVPRFLSPGQRWRGTFAGRGRLTNVPYLRVELGRFNTVGPAQPGVPWRFRYITDHVLRLQNAR
jgi:hypothetical protein